MLQKFVYVIFSLHVLCLSSKGIFFDTEMLHIPSSVLILPLNMTPLSNSGIHRGQGLSMLQVTVTLMICLKTADAGL